MTATATPMRNVQRWATITPDGVHRYCLTRSWSPEPETVDQHRPVVWIMLNPSTADGEIDDPTVRRCMGYTRTWGYCLMTVVNLFAYRATDPASLLAAREAGVDVVGELNDSVIISSAEEAALVVAAWGSHRFARRRAEIVLNLIDPERGSPLSGTPVTCLGRNTDGQPRHPLYQHRDAQLEVLRG